MKSLPSSIVYARWLAFMRVLTGGIWLIHAIPKFTQSDEFMPPNGFIVIYVTKGLQTTSPGGMYHNFLANIVQPNLPIFAEMVRLGELMVGVSLVLGVLTRLGGLGGVVLTLNYMAARGGLLSFDAWASLDAALLIMSLTNLVLPTGRVLGIDMFFGRQKVEEPATVRAVFVDEPPIGPPPSAAPPPPPPPSGPTTLGP
jgi:thiosulfate dehydrogenase (quinone) large subunit